VTDPPPATAQPRVWRELYTPAWFVTRVGLWAAPICLFLHFAYEGIFVPLTWAVLAATVFAAALGRVAARKLGVPLRSGGSKPRRAVFALAYVAIPFFAGTIVHDLRISQPLLDANGIAVADRFAAAIAAGDGHTEAKLFYKAWWGYHYASVSRDGPMRWRRIDVGDHDATYRFAREEGGKCQTTSLLYELGTVVGHWFITGSELIESRVAPGSC
jgi:hypothetical protein